MNNKPQLYNIGKQLLEQFQLKNNRILFEFNNKNIESIESIKDFIVNNLNIPFQNDSIDIIYKQIPEKDRKSTRLNSSH